MSQITNTKTPRLLSICVICVIRGLYPFLLFVSVSLWLCASVVTPAPRLSLYSPPRDGGDDRDLIAGAQGCLEVLHEADILVVDVDINKAVNLIVAFV